MWWSMEIMARYFIMIFMPAGPMLNCVPDSWPWFFKITLVTPLSFNIAESMVSHSFYKKLAELYIGPWSNKGIRHLTKGMRTQCIALIRACRPVEAIK